MSTSTATFVQGAEPEPPPRAGWFSRTFRAFVYRDFRLVWFGAFTSTTGTWMQTVAQSWVVLSMTGSAFYLGLDAFLATVPMIFFSLLGGVVADRFERRKILLWSQYLQMTFAIILALLIWTKSVRIWHIFILSFCTGSVQAFGGPAYQALLPLLVKREDTPNAIALNSLQFNLARMVGPVLAGFALASVGAAACFGLNALSFVAVIISLLLIHPAVVASQGKITTVMEEMREGFGFLKEEKAITQLTILAMLSTMFGMPLVTMLPVVVKRVFVADARFYGWLMAASAAGSVTGALIVAGAAHQQKRGRLALYFQLAFAVFLLSFALSRTIWISMVAVFLAGASLLGVITMISSLVQLRSTEEMRGRVMSIFMLAFRGGMPIGNLFSGYIAERYGVTTALTFNAISMALVGLSFLIPKTRLKEV